VRFWLVVDYYVKLLVLEKYVKLLVLEKGINIKVLPQATIIISKFDFFDTLKK
jgi:hypothetical protein